MASAVERAEGMGGTIFKRVRGRGVYNACCIPKFAIKVQKVLSGSGQECGGIVVGGGWMRLGGW